MGGEQMSRYLLILSEDSIERREAERLHELTAQLRRPGHEVTLFLVQNAVLPARATCRYPVLSPLIDSGVEVLADEFSLRERGIQVTELMSGVRAAPLDVVIERLASGCKVLWN
jgi:intracellular sulfur oxidation DsrE/DsrF family protein